MPPALASVNDDQAPAVVSVKSFPEVSRMLTDHERRLRAAEEITKPVHRIWAALKWGWVPGAILFVTGAAPGSPLGRLLEWLTTQLPQ